MASASSMLLVESISKSIDLSQVSALAATAESMLRDQSLNQFQNLIDPGLLSWAASLDLKDDDLEAWADEPGDLDDTDDLRSDSDSVKARALSFARLLLATATRLQAGAARLRVAAGKVNDAVDSVNEQAERYEKLALTVLKLYGGVHRAGARAAEVRSLNPSSACRVCAMLDTEQLVAVRDAATRFRAALEQGGLRLISLQEFPHSSCGDTCELLGQYLSDSGLGPWIYRSGKQETPFLSHAWLEREGLILDIRP